MNRNVEKSVLKAVELAARTNAKSNDGRLSFCPVFFHQPKRPIQNKKH